MGFPAYTNREGGGATGAPGADGAPGAPGADGAPGAPGADGAAAPIEPPKFRTFTFLEDLAAFQVATAGGGAAVRDDSGAQLTGGATSPTGVVAVSNADWYSAPVWDQNPEIAAGLYIDPAIDCHAFVTFGGFNNNLAAIAPPPDHMGFIFSVVSGVVEVRASVGNSGGTTLSDPLTFDNQSGDNLYYAKMTSGQKVEFFIDGILVQTITTHLPTGQYSQYIWTVALANDDASLSSHLTLSGVQAAWNAGVGTLATGISTFAELADTDIGDTYALNNFDVPVYAAGKWYNQPNTFNLIHDSSGYEIDTNTTLNDGNILVWDSSLGDNGRFAPQIPSGGGASITHKKLTSADETTCTGSEDSPGTLNGISLDIAAAVGDDIEVTLELTGYVDIGATLGVGITVGLTTYLRGKTKTNGAGYNALHATIVHTVVSGDLSGGNVTCLGRAGTSSGSLSPVGTQAKTLLEVKNLGPTA